MNFKMYLRGCFYISDNEVVPQIPVSIFISVKVELYLRYDLPHVTFNTVVSKKHKLVPQVDVCWLLNVPATC